MAITIISRSNGRRIMFDDIDINQPGRWWCWTPQLVWQAWQIRGRVMRLPEAYGARDGVCGQGERLRLLLVGDSAMAGVGVRHQQHALSGQLSALLGQYCCCQWRLWAQSGLNAEGLWRMLTQMPKTEQNCFDVAVVSIGVNDATAMVAGKSWLESMRRVHRLLLQRFGVRHVLYTAVPPLQRFTALPAPLSTVLGAKAAQLNRLLMEHLAPAQQCSIVQSSLPFQAEFLAADGFHPSASGYQLWAAEVLNRLLQQQLIAAHS